MVPWQSEFMRLFPVVILIMLVPNISLAQDKYEREFKIQRELAPTHAQDFIDDLNPESKIKWYKEYALNAVSLEAKFIKNNTKFSVEFDTLGNLQDVEFVIDKDLIPSAIFSRICQNLDTLFEKWKLQKIQTQYIGSPKQIITLINEQKRGKSIKIAYEIVLKGKSAKHAQLYEITFSETGENQSLQKITQHKADHLEY